jgi:hypothetical protein
LDPGIVEQQKGPLKAASFFVGEGNQSEMPCIFFSHHVGYCYRWWWWWWWWWRKWEWNMGAIKRGRKKDKQCSPGGGVVSSTILHRGIILGERRCELEQKLAAFEEKLGLFYFSGGGNCEDVDGSEGVRVTHLSVSG